MNKEEMESLVKQLKAAGLNEEQIMETFYEAFQEGEMDRKDLEACAEFLGYELTDDFKADETPDPIASGEEGEGISKEVAEEAKEIQPGESAEEFKEKVEAEEPIEAKPEVEEAKPEEKPEEPSEPKEPAEEKKEEEEKPSEPEKSEEEEWEEVQKKFKW